MQDPCPNCRLDAHETWCPAYPREIKHERVIAEKDHDGWLVMFPSGDVTHASSRKSVLSLVKARLGSADIMVTEIEWRS